MPAPISREYRIYLALWRKAYKSPEPVIIKASSFSMAVAMRQGMYRAIRPFRKGEATDNDLMKAAEKLVVYLVKAEDKSSPHFLEFRERKALSELEAAWADLGIDEEDLLLGDERSVSDSLIKLMDKQDTPVTTNTPFYSREA